MDDLGRNARALRKRMTPAELRLWQHIRGGRLGTRFRRQEPLGGYIVDFVSRPERIVIELDGDGHHEPTDAARDRSLVGLGFRVVRVENRVVLHDLDLLLDVLRRMVRDPGWEPSPYWWV